MWDCVCCALDFISYTMKCKFLKGIFNLLLQIDSFWKMMISQPAAKARQPRVKFVGPTFKLYMQMWSKVCVHLNQSSWEITICVCSMMDKSNNKIEKFFTKSKDATRSTHLCINNFPQIDFVIGPNDLLCNFNFTPSNLHHHHASTMLQNCTALHCT